MVINGPGKYATEAGHLVTVESWDGYRRAYGKDGKGAAISWYVDGNVRSGSCNGNRVILRIVDDEK